MYHVKFDPQGSALRIQITFFGGCTASYVYTLWEKNSNAKVEERAGNNQNDQDDQYVLPIPVQQNEGRIAEIFSTLKNADSQETRGIVAVEIKQGGTLLFCSEVPDGIRISGKTFTLAEDETIKAGKTTLNDLFIILLT